MRISWGISSCVSSLPPSCAYSTKGSQVVAYEFIMLLHIGLLPAARPAVAWRLAEEKAGGVLDEEDAGGAGYEPLSMEGVYTVAAESTHCFVHPVRWGLQLVEFAGCLQG